LQGLLHGRSYDSVRVADSTSGQMAAGADHPIDNPITEELFRNQIRSRNVFVEHGQDRSICGRKLT
jgi:hypothetical protein